MGKNSKKDDSLLKGWQESGELRISGGSLKGQKIKTPGGRTHPMGERERIALFNMLGDRVNGRWVIDAYSGSGALAIEALSRGAVFALCLEKSHKAVRTINENFAKLGLDEHDAPRGGAIQVDVPVAARTATDRYHIILADPPYDDFRVEMVSCLPRLLSPQGILVVSHPGDAPELPGVTLEKSRKYSGCTISIYTRDD